MKRSTLLISVITIFTFILLAGCSIPIGDGDKLKIGSDGVQISTKDGDEVDISIDGEEGTVQMTGTDAEGNETTIDLSADDETVRLTEVGEDGEETVFEIKEHNEIPATLPSDVPIPNDADIVQAADITSGDVINVQIVLKGKSKSLDKYADTYRKYANKSYETIEELQINENAFNIVATNGENDTFYVLISEEEDGTDIIISYESLK